MGNLIRKIRSAFSKIILVILTFAIPLSYALLIPTVGATDVTGNISTNTTWDLASSPYNITGNIFINSGAVLTIDAGVEVRSNSNYYIRIDSGSLDVNGTSGNEVVFTHNSSTAAGAWSGILIDPGETATIDFAEFYYANVAIKNYGGTLIVNDSLFQTNHVGIDVYEQGTLTTARNTFNNQTYYPLVVNTDFLGVTLGFGADADILGITTELNGYNAIGIAYADNQTVVCPVDLCILPQRTFAGISNIPYIIHDDYYFDGSDDTLQIDAGVIIKQRRDAFHFRNGAQLDVNGTSGNEVIFTSHLDDTYGGDTNNDGTATSPAVNNWDGIYLQGDSSIIDFAKIYYSNVGVKVNSDSTALVVNDTLFESNNVGIDVYERASLTTARNTFNKQTYYPLVLNTDVTTINFGSGGDTDILGIGGELNGYNAIGVAYADYVTSNCTLNLCTLPQRTFAGLSNIPYVIHDDYYFDGSANTLQIDAGVIIKYRNDSFRFRSGSQLDINGTSGNEVVFTSQYDDTYGGDTNNDGTATSPVVGNWDGILLEGGISNIQYAKMMYAYYGVRVTNTDTNLTVSDTLFESNNVGIDVYERASLTTARNTFNKQTYYPLVLNTDVTTINFGSGGDTDILGTGGELNGYNAIGVAYADYVTSNCTLNLCVMPQRTFAGLSNIPYVIHDDYFFDGSDDTLQIDAGVVIKYRNDSFRFRSGSQLDINGTSGNEVIFTSQYDDTYGGDTNNDGTATSPVVGNWDGILLEGGISNIQYAKMMYAYFGVRVTNTDTNLTVSDTLFESNNVGIDVYERASLTTARNTFNKQTYYPLVLNTDVTTINLGSGGDTDILGIGGELNGYNAIGIRYTDNVTNNCTLNLCTLPQRTFAGLSNIPYVIHDDYFFDGSDDTLQIDAGVIIKQRIDTFHFRNGAQLDVNGTSGNEVVFTSQYDDTYGGDTNNDGIATSPAVSNWDGIYLQGDSSIIDFAKIFYANVGVQVALDNTSLAVSDTLFESNNVGIDVYERASLTTARNTFNKQTYYPLVLNTDVTIINFGSGGDTDFLGIGGELNGYNAIGIRYTDNQTTNCTLNLCTLPQRTFAGLSNIPYVMHEDYYFDGSDDTMQIDAGVVLKARHANVDFYFRSGASIDINGTATLPVIYTSISDDTAGGDTNNDGTATSPAKGNISGIRFEGAGANTIDYFRVRYANYGIYINGATSLTINDSKFSHSNYGIYSNTSTSPVLADVNVENNTWGIYNLSSTVINAESVWWGAADGPIDTDDGGSCLINSGAGVEVRDTASNPVDYCPYATTEKSAPTVSTQAATDVENTTATGNGTITTEFIGDVIDYGHVWSLDPNIVIINGGTDPIVQYKLNDNLGTSNIIDSKSVVNGIYSGSGGSDDYTSTHTIGGKINSALSFDGVDNNIIVVDTNDDLSLTNSLAVSMWIYPQDLTDGGILGKYDNNGEYNYVIWYESGFLKFAVGSLDSFETEITTNVVNSTTWYHIVGTYDHSTLKLYVDGTMVASIAENRDVSSASAYNHLCIGNVRYNCSNSHAYNQTDAYYNGYIDDVRIFDKALIQGEIDALYNSGSGTENITSPTAHLSNGAPSVSGAYTTSIISLVPGAQYYTKAYLETSDNELLYGATETFTTAPVACAWIGGSGDWETAANWSCGGTNRVPDAADNVTIDLNVTVNLNATTTVDNLVIGDISSIYSPILNFNYDAITNGALIIDDLDLMIHPGATVTHTTGTVSVVGTVNIDVQTGDATINGSIDVQGKGYAEAQGPGAGGYGPGTGAGHGGEGGNDSFNENPGGGTYGSLTTPTVYGSGGGTDGVIGGIGGGAIKLNVANELILAGSISAAAQVNPGYSSYDSGGGSGGSIYITTNLLSGAGSVSANGSDGYRYGGAGAGGRIAMYYTTDTSTVTYTSYGGLVGYEGGHIAAAGTIYRKSSVGNGDVVIDNSSRDAGVKYTDLQTATTLDSLSISNLGNFYSDLTQTITTINISTNGIFHNSATSNTTYTTLNWNSTGVIIDRGGTFDLLSGGGALVVPTGAILYADTARSYTGVTIDGTLTHSENWDTEVYNIRHTVTGAGTYTVSATGLINTDGQGFGQGYGTGKGANGNGSGGGGYGGEGGDSNSGQGGSTYGSLTVPVSLGSGGGIDGVGGEGGGSIKLDVTGGSIVVNGSISSKGDSDSSANYDGGGGSGGSIYLITDNLSGSGTISADGGPGGTFGYTAGSGGGGRIAMYFTNDTSTITYSAKSGGTNGVTSVYGAAGTIYKEDSDGDKIVSIDNGGLINNSNFAYLPGSLVVDDINVDNYGALKLDTSITTTSFDLSNNSSLQLEATGVLGYTTYTWLSGGTIIDRGGTFTPISSAGSLTIPATTYLFADTTRSYTDVTINGTLTHSANGSTEVYMLNHTTTGNYTINSGGSINVQSKGYAQSEGPGDGNYGPGTGAGHGGEGGNDSYNNNPGGVVYGSLTAPVNIGSGGGIDAVVGASGGGAVRLDVGGTLNVVGNINAEAQVNPGYDSIDSGGGSGGSVYITTDTLIGTSSISTNGSNGYRYGGAGGGGRIAIYYTTDTSSVTYTSYGGLEGGSGGHIAAAGTIYIKPASSNGTVTIDNSGRDSGAKYTYMPSGITVDILDINNHGNLYSNSTYTVNTINLSTNGSFHNGSLNNTTYTTLTWGGSTTIYDRGGTFNLLSGAGNLTVPNTSTLYANTIRSYSDVIINGTVTHSENYTTEVNKMDLTSTGNFIISATGKIDASLKGYQDSEGPGAGTDNATMSGGAGYGGVGGWTLGGPVYGSEAVPVNIGSGGGHETVGHGGRGGGAISLNVSGILDVTGEILVNGGEFVGSDSGGGSGGSLYIATDTLTGAGNLYAKGGNGGYYDPYDGGGGGGGRIAIYYSTWSWTGNTLTPPLATDGGLGKNGEDGADGTVYLESLNQLPTMSGVSIDSAASAVNLTENTTQNVSCFGTVTDLDGYLDIAYVTAYLYRTGVGSGAADNNNNHYTLTGNVNCVPSNGLNTTEDYTCTFPVYYFAEATDVGSTYEADSWTCLMVPNDGTGDGASDSDAIEVNSLLAVGVTSAINYGSMDQGTNTTGDILAEVTNTGNTSVDMDLSGSNMCTDYPTCASNSIAVAKQEYSLTSFLYGGGSVLGTSTTRIQTNLSKPTLHPSNSSLNTYWALGVPALQNGGAYSGENIFTAVLDE